MNEPALIRTILARVGAERPDIRLFRDVSTLARVRIQWIMCGLSLVYVKAVATSARLFDVRAKARPGQCRFRGQTGGRLRPALDLHLKATTGIGKVRYGFLPFRLGIKNYSELCDATQTPRLLAVLELPEVQSQWMTRTAEELALRRRAYGRACKQGTGKSSDNGLARFVSMKAICSTSMHFGH